MSHQIQEFTTGEYPGNTDEAMQLSTTDIPPWLDVNHPEFPRHFIFSAMDKNGEVLRWWQRLPKRLGGEA
ncbi:hypothetical protein [Nostoc sp.]|uniref:hypothetical protein n=1 Tax=Nostoc sp. TaxID=1180 RepID=UPI002FF6035F